MARLIITAIIIGNTQYPKVQTLAKKDKLVPSSFALIVTNIEPSQVITNTIEKIFWKGSCALKETDIENRIHKTKGPHKSHYFSY